ncbi:hypothetical protein EFK50_05620 [Nocardioides marmoriginsengisoli]|uniref:Uncharacterized protein n=1 Tax=Nocardioides marmoriginsengisoli TaxID=661483 RepID=A0A3N0CPY1_9ACTN|nr:hypothetical protein [Nocardioides marmoriginsengisoli]RNL65430.1 hypothetical protein EFK50_05620 [Nocardioides marmoriginsengisoli]
MATIKDLGELFAEGLFKAIAVWAGVMALIVLLATRAKPEALSLSVLIVFTFAAVGALVGFIMGIPKPSEGDEATLTADLSATRSAIVRLSYNTGLAKISTAVTTLIVGFSVAQFGTVIDRARDLGSTYQDVFGSELFAAPAARSAYGMGLSISALILGFIFMFMWTTTRLLDVLRKTIEERGGAGDTADK